MGASRTLKLAKSVTAAPSTTKKLPSSLLKKVFVFAVPKSICLSQYSFCSSDKHSPSNDESDELTRPRVLGVTEEIICSFLREDSSESCRNAEGYAFHPTFPVEPYSDYLSILFFPEETLRLMSTLF